ncbi:MAG: two pore domain potassium channel family protein, partial [Myxococcales bacterium]|nr:two pore domain potassium channel family protein [Myxococcales bacterium]
MNRLLGLLHEAFHRPGPLQRRVEGVVYLLIAASVVLVLLDVLRGHDDPLVQALEPVDRVLLWAFGAELLARVISYRPPALDFYAPRFINMARFHLLGRLRYLLQPLVMVDLITVLALVPALRGLRAVRLLRLLRAARLFRYSDPFEGLARAFADNRLLYYFGFSLVGGATVLGGVTIYLVESAENANIRNLGDGLWWALVTLTTVGFGDIAPVSGMGRVIGGLLMVTGMVTLGLFAGIVGHTLPRAIFGIREEQIRMSGYLNHLIVVGYEPGARMFLDALLEERDAEDP